MGLDEVYQVLKKNKGKWMSAKDISKKIGISQRTVSISLQKLRKYEDRLIVKEQGSFYGGYLWRLK